MLELVTITRNTRGANSREISYKAIGKFTERQVDRESKPVFNEDGSPKLDDNGYQVREPLGKDEKGNQITYKEIIKDFTSDGVLTDIADALTLVNGNEQVLLDCFADGFNERQYQFEANKDDLDEVIKASGLSLNEDQIAAIKRAARGAAKGTGENPKEFAEFMIMKMQKKAAVTA